jgi:hypothetical protein
MPPTALLARAYLPKKMMDRNCCKKLKLNLDNLLLVPFYSFLSLRFLAPVFLSLSLHGESFLAGHV